MTNFIPDLRAMRPSDLAANIIFFDASLIRVDAVELTDLLQQALRGLFFESDRFFRFRINPDKLDVKSSKLTASTLTASGYERSHFGNDWTRFSYSGTTGAFRPPNPAETGVRLFGLNEPEQARALASQAILAGHIDITKSPVNQKFRRFEKFYRGMNDEVIMYYDLRIMRGSLTDFSYAENANSPYEIRYSFTFEAHTDEASGPDRFGRAIRYLGAP